MRIVTVRIEDNTDKIKKVKKLESKKYEFIENVSDKIDELQEEGFMQILAYVRCAYEDYIGIIEEVRELNERCFVKNTLNVYNFAKSVRICVGKERVIIDFDYAGTLNCRNTPPRMEAEFKNDSIIITKSTRQGICDLMKYWNSIKPEFQKTINKAYENKISEIKTETNNLVYLLQVAEEFKV